MHNEETLLPLQFPSLNMLKPWNKTWQLLSLASFLYCISKHICHQYLLYVNHNSLLPSHISNYPIIESISRCTFKYYKYRRAGGWIYVIMVSLSWESGSPQALKITSARQPFPCFSVIQAQLNRKQLTWLLFFY